MRTLILLLLPIAAMATDKAPTPQYPTQTSAQATAGAMAESASQSAAQAVSGDAAATATNAGVSLGSSYDSKVLALGLSTAAGAQFVQDCHESWGGKNGTIVSTGGRVTLNSRCIEHRQCMEIVNAYAALGAREEALEQLEKCGGVNPRSIKPPACERSDRIEAELRECLEK